VCVNELTARKGTTRRAVAGSMATFENDLAKSFGPDDAHRIAFDEHLGMCSGTYGGAPPRGK
jgi:hypothetical protein